MECVIEEILYFKSFTKIYGKVTSSNGEHSVHSPSIRDR